MSEGGGGILQEGMFQQSKQCEASCRKHFKAKEETRITHTHTRRVSISKACRTHLST